MADLSDEALVVRGGVNRDPMRLLEEFKTQIALGDQPRLSVFAANPIEGEARMDTVRRIALEARIPNGKVQVGAAEALRACGLDLVDERDDDEAECHFHVYFPHAVAKLSESIMDWLECFEEPIPNPAKEGPK